MKGFVLVLVLAAMVCVEAAHSSKLRKMQRGKVEVDVDVGFALGAEITSQAQLISRINQAASLMRTEMGSRTKGYLCKTIYATEARAFPYADRFLASKYGQWIPTGTASVSVFLQGEASAKAFVGISAGVGVGLDMTVERGTTATGQVHLFACLGASFSMGYVGASAFVGAGVLVGFGTFKDSIVASNVEIGADVGALGAGGVGILLDVKGALETFAAEWRAYEATKIGPPARTVEYATKCWELFKATAKAGGHALAHGTVALVKGVHVSGGAGVGGGAGVSVDVDMDAIIDGIKTGFNAIWSSKAGSWVKNSAAWQALKAKLERVGSSKFGQAWKAAAVSVSKGLRHAVDAANEFFDYVPLSDSGDE